MGLICTSDGCIHLCNHNSKECSFSWRSDSNYSSFDIPQYCTYSESTNQIISGRGPNSTILWDLNSQKLIHEWYNPGTTGNVTSIESDGNLCYIGYSNGALNVFDIRSSDFIHQGVIRADSEIIKIFKHFEHLYLATESGLIVHDPNSIQFRSITHSSLPFTHFSFQRQFSLFSSISGSEPPKLYNISGDLLFDTSQLKRSLNNTSFEFHPSLPLIAFGTDSGEILSYSVS